MARATPLRRIDTIIAVALAVSTTPGPASARTFDLDSRGSLVQQPAPSISRTRAPTAARGSIDWGYIAIGSSALALVLTGVCAAVTTGRRHAQHDKPRRAPSTSQPPNDPRRTAIPSSAEQTVRRETGAAPAGSSCSMETMTCRHKEGERP